MTKKKRIQKEVDNIMLSIAELQKIGVVKGDHSIDFKVKRARESNKYLSTGIEVKLDFTIDYNYSREELDV